MGQYGETWLETSDTREIRAGAPVQCPHNAMAPQTLDFQSRDTIIADYDFCDHHWCKSLITDPGAWGGSRQEMRNNAIKSSN